jgi:hypothetical protein
LEGATILGVSEIGDDGVIFSSVSSLLQDDNRANPNNVINVFFIV